MTKLTINSRGGADFTVSLQSPKGGAGCSFLHPQKGGVSYLSSMTHDVL